MKVERHRGCTQMGKARAEEVRRKKLQENGDYWETLDSMVDRMVLKSFSGPIVTDLDARAFLVGAFGRLDVSQWTEEQQAEVLDDQLLLHAMARQSSPEQTVLDQELSDYRLNGVDEADHAKEEEASEEASEDCVVTRHHIVTGSATPSVAGTGYTSGGR